MPAGYLPHQMLEQYSRQSSKHILEALHASNLISKPSATKALGLLENQARSLLDDKSQTVHNPLKPLQINTSLSNPLDLSKLPPAIAVSMPKYQANNNTNNNTNASENNNMVNNNSSPLAGKAADKAADSSPPAFPSHATAISALRLMSQQGAVTKFLGEQLQGNTVIKYSLPKFSSILYSLPKFTASLNTASLNLVQFHSFNCLKTIMLVGHLF